MLPKKTLLTIFVSLTAIHSTDYAASINFTNNPDSSGPITIYTFVSHEDALWWVKAKTFIETQNKELEKGLGMAQEINKYLEPILDAAVGIGSKDTKSDMLNSASEKAMELKGNIGEIVARGIVKLHIQVKVGDPDKTYRTDKGFLNDPFIVSPGASIRWNIPQIMVNDLDVCLQKNTMIINGGRRAKTIYMLGFSPDSTLVFAGKCPFDTQVNVKLAEFKQIKGWLGGYTITQMDSSTPITEMNAPVISPTMQLTEKLLELYARDREKARKEKEAEQALLQQKK